MENRKFDLFDKLVNNLNMEVLEHGHFFGDTSWKFYNVNSPFNRIYIVLDGVARIENRFQTLILKPGNMYLIPAYSINNYICDHFIEKIYFHFRLELFGSIDMFEEISRCICTPFDKDEVDSLVSALNSNSLMGVLFSKATLFDIVLKLLANQSMYQLGNESFTLENQSLNSLEKQSLEKKIMVALKYKDIFRYIKNNCSAKLTPDIIAYNLNTPVSSLIKTFKKDTGGTLKQYIDKMIIHKAKEELLTSNSSIKEIAYKLKFSDEFYFSRFFKKHTGIPPSKYRIQNKL